MGSQELGLSVFSARNQKPNETPISGDQPNRSSTMENIVVTGIRGLPLIRAGDNIPAMICERVKVENGDILSLASTIYSKAKGFTKSLADITPSKRALRLAELNKEDPRFVQAVIDASK